MRAESGRRRSADRSAPQQHQRRRPVPQVVVSERLAVSWRPGEARHSIEQPPRCSVGASAPVDPPRSRVGAVVPRSGAVSGRLPGGRSPPYSAAAPQLRQRRRPTAASVPPPRTTGRGERPAAANLQPWTPGAVAGTGSEGGGKGLCGKSAVVPAWEENATLPRYRQVSLQLPKAIS